MTNGKVVFSSEQIFVATLNELDSDYGSFCCHSSGTEQLDEAGSHPIDWELGTVPVATPFRWVHPYVLDQHLRRELHGGQINRLPVRCEVKANLC